tara:strand:+ start:2546 stop:2872 length:327 start_codon:yes stop_codon:yes gene_type:complete
MANAVTAFEGWNSSTQSWNASTWGNGVASPAFSSTSGIGSVTVIFNTEFAPVTGLVTAARVNGVEVLEGTGVSISVSGLQANASVGNAVVWGRVIPDATTTWTEMVVA